MAMGTIADDVEPRHKQASTPRFPQPGVLVVPSGPASVHATSSNRQVAAKPAHIQRTAARQTAMKLDLSGSRLQLLVRHANAGNNHRWQGPNSLRPLLLAGQAEAAGLVIGLEDYPIWRILTSPTLRCRQTMQPLARDRRLRIERESALGVDADLARVLALLEDPRMQDMVMCTHGEVIGHDSRGWSPTDWWSTSRCSGPRDRPGCCTAPTDDSPTPATCHRWSWPLPGAWHRHRAEVLAPDANARPGVGITTILERPIPP
jgi:hypothetical protein